MVESIHIENFMGHQLIKIDKLSQLNVIIGQNDSGKTGILKLIYACLRSVDEYGKRQEHENITYKKILADKLLNTFQPGRKGLGELVRKNGKEKLNIEFKLDNKSGYKEKINFSFGSSTNNTIIECNEDVKILESQKGMFLFIPPKEVLTASKAIKATKDILHIPGFDDTYQDLISAINIPGVQGNIFEEFKTTKKVLNELFEGSISPSADEEFVFKKGQIEIPMSLTAEGVKKIGIISTLINNRCISKNSVLFIDEPETTLHPLAILKLVQILVLLSKTGVQIFIATHSLFVLKQLELFARKDELDIPCLILKKNSETGNPLNSIINLKDSMPQNAILDALDELTIQDFNIE